MEDILKYKNKVADDGFAIFKNIYSPEEIEEILTTINSVDTSSETFRKSSDLFAIRQFLKEVPDSKNLIFNSKLKSLISDLFGDDYFVVKSIFFDKPETSNWYVSYHQDLTISVNKKIDLKNFGPWTIKQNQFAVQPPINILQNIFTVRIHLDDTDENNGALKVIPQSHLKGICRSGTLDWKTETEISCAVPKGGIMIMKPLLLHSSCRTNNNKRRRVIHIEFSNQELPIEIQWSERTDKTAII